MKKFLFLFCLLFVLPLTAKASINIWDTRLLPGLCNSSNCIGSVYSIATEFQATSTGYITDLKFYGHCNYADGCESTCRLFNVPANEDAPMTAQDYWFNQTVLKEVSFIQPYNTGCDTQTYDMIDDDGVFIASSSKYTIVCRADHNLMCFDDSDDGTNYYLNSQNILMRRYTFDSIYFDDNPIHFYMEIDSNYVPPDINISTIEIKYPPLDPWTNATSTVPDFQNFILTYRMDQAQINYINSKQATTYLDVWLESADADYATTTDFALRLESEQVPLVATDTDWIIPKSGILTPGNYRAIADIRIEYDCITPEVCTTEYVGESLPRYFTIDNESGYDQTLLTWRSDINSVQQMTCIIGQPCKLWFSYNDMAISKPVYLYQESCNQTATNCITQRDYYVASTTIQFSPNHQNNLSIPATTTESILKYDLYMVDPEFGDLALNGIKVNWVSSSTFEHLINTALGIDTREDALMHACDDVASSTGTFDDLRYGVECGARKLFVWAFTPSDTAMADNQAIIEDVKAGFPFNIFSTIKNIFGTLANGTRGTIQVKFDPLIPDSQASINLNTDPIKDNFPWYKLYIYPALNYAIWLGLFVHLTILIRSLLLKQNNDR